MAWLKVDSHSHEHPKLHALRQRTGRKADSACWGWILMLAAAKRYGEWTFASDDHLIGALGPYACFIEDFRAVGLLDGLTIHNADVYQDSRTGWRDRKALSRQRHADNGVTTK